MNVFLSWSGPTSKQVAQALDSWLGKVIQGTKTWMSPNTKKGTNWSTYLADQLENTNVGIICITPDNLESLWLHFEAGAIFKSTNDSLICPFLFRVDSSDLAEPFSQFQATVATKDDTLRLVQTINSMLSNENRLSEIEVIDVFDHWWPKLKEQLANIEYKSPEVDTKFENLKDTLFRFLTELAKEIDGETKIQLSPSTESNSYFDGIDTRASSSETSQSDTINLTLSPTGSDMPEKTIIPVIPPMSQGDLDINMITVIFRPRADKVSDNLLLRRVFGLMIAYPGNDRFAFHIFEKGRGNLLEFPNLTTGMNPELMVRLNELIGPENIRIEPITFL